MKCEKINISRRGEQIAQSPRLMALGLAPLGLTEGRISTNLLAGLVTAIVIVASTLGYATMIFSGVAADELPFGIGHGLMGAGLTAIIFALWGGIPFAIAGPDSKPAAVLAVLAATVAADLAAQGHPEAIAPTVVVGIVVATLLTGAMLLLMGSLKTGRLIRSVPYSVVGGFMAASGWLLVAGGLRVLTGFRISWDALPHLSDINRLPQLAVGLLFVVLMHRLRGNRHVLAFPALLLIGTLGTHLLLWGLGVSQEEALASGWLLNTPTGAVLPDIWLSGVYHGAHALSLLHEAGTYIALIAVTATTLLLGVLAVEVDARLDVDVDRELRVNGFACLISGLFGGMIGTLSVSRSLLNQQMGARGRSSSILAGIFCLLLLAFGTRFLSYFSLPLLAAMLIQSGVGMLEEWLVRGWKRLTRADYAQVVFIMLIIVNWDFVAGVAVGILVACVSFAVNFSRIRLVKLGLNRSNFSSRVDRPSSQHDKLIRHGEGIQIMWLHGFMFFGSVNRLFLHVKDTVGGLERTKSLMIILDFRQVLGIDSSAILSLIKLRHLAEREGFVIVLSHLPPQVRESLTTGGFSLRDDDPHLKLFSDIDAALEWCEDRLLEEHLPREESLRSADEWLAREMGDALLVGRLTSYLEMIEFQPGETLFHQGEAGDALYLIYSGRVTVLFHTHDGKDVRLRSMVRHTVVGEMALYRDGARGASVKVDQAAIVYKLSQEAMAQMELDDPALAHAFHRFIIRILAMRLDFANREIGGLQN